MKRSQSPRLSERLPFRCHRNLQPCPTARPLRVGQMSLEILMFLHPLTLSSGLRRCCCLTPAQAEELLAFLPRYRQSQHQAPHQDQHQARCPGGSD